MNRRCVYYVEGECERQLINSLKEQPGMVVPGKVKVYNVIQNAHYQIIAEMLFSGTPIIFRESWSRIFIR